MSVSEAAAWARAHSTEGVARQIEAGDAQLLRWAEAEASQQAGRPNLADLARGSGGCCG